MYELEKIGKVFTSKFVGTGPSSCKEKNLPGRGLTKVQKHCNRALPHRFTLHAKFDSWCKVSLLSYRLWLQNEIIYQEEVNKEKVNTRDQLVAHIMNSAAFIKQLVARITIVLPS